MTQTPLLSMIASPTWTSRIFRDGMAHTPETKRLNNERETTPPLILTKRRHRPQGFCSKLSPRGQRQLEAHEWQFVGRGGAPTECQPWALGGRSFLGLDVTLPLA